jgi:hypothetical protein
MKESGEKHRSKDINRNIGKEKGSEERRQKERHCREKEIKETINNEERGES